MTRHRPRHINDLLHRVSPPIPQIERPLLLAFQGPDMRLRQIHDMDVIPDTRPVRRRIIPPEHRHFVQLTQRNLQHIRDQMGLRIVILPELLRRARRIEITQENRLQSSPLPAPRQHLLKLQLGLPVRIRRTLRHIFMNRNLLRLTIRRARRGKHNPWNPHRLHRLHQMHTPLEIIPEIHHRVLHRLPHQSIRRKMHHRIRLDLLHRLPGCVPVPQIPHNQTRPTVHRLPVAPLQVVKHHHLMTPVQQKLRGYASNVARTACDKIVHPPDASLHPAPHQS